VLSLMADDVIFIVPGKEPFGKEAFAASATGMMKVRIVGTSDIQNSRSRAIGPGCAPVSKSRLHRQMESSRGDLGRLRLSCARMPMAIGLSLAILIF
jgi:hypothetical protein